MTLLQAMGGLGIFLLGMFIMTDGLRALTGNTIQKLLIRFTQTPVSGALTGGIATAILQSSSATTVAAVGFVGAGLLTFPSALGIIFGANIGTTITGWLVALIGFKLQVGTLVMPLILAGVLMRLFAKTRIGQVGYALAGFGLIFVGIDAMQQGMAGLESHVIADTFPANTFSGRLLLVLLGIVVTLITQSSSAGVATALTALFTGTIEFEQAAALIIGMDVGTTVTAVIATIGGSVGSRRTGLSHLVYNLMTALLALALLTPYITAWNQLLPNQLIANAEIALVGFHTLFNFIGLLVILPFTHQFATLIIRIIPESRSGYADALDQKLVNDPIVAMSVVDSTIKRELIALLNHLRSLLSNSQAQHNNLTTLQRALDETHAFVDLIHIAPDKKAELNRVSAALHILDHMQRLHERCNEEIERLEHALHDEHLNTFCQQLADKIREIITALETNQFPAAHTVSVQLLELTHSEMDEARNRIMYETATGARNVPNATSALEAVRWLRRITIHINRCMYHLAES
ncbi:MAG: Na/Pi symporter [Sedimenticola sp.]|nr:Na/Pi symporter [Sedimenticola sp.]